ncbi:basic leucine zipper 4 [Rhodamnia argentea]|uniref:Basic leucine zipper 4 n=1 Tax=Rhodamnia argentea TaxID=178133 RepID=A0A8B8P151_9MYRT|nr:basic leucine zipper 4 [Rhodamnia argentea]
MFCSDDPVQLQLPVLETGFPYGELEELLSFLQSDNPTVSPNNSGSEGSNRTLSSPDDRKRRRMMSNRESARRSRWRKKKHLEDTTNELNQLGAENQELKSQLDYVASRFFAVQAENERLRSECASLSARLSDLHWILLAMQNHINPR